MLYEVRDPIHQTITFNEEERRVIDHSFFQRLRFIYQLGLSSLVYPGAVHSRFIHCLGAMHLAGRVFAALDEQSDVFRRLGPAARPYIQRVLRLAALLHDIGHGPFSHASERLMPKLGLLKIPKQWWSKYDPGRRAAHEDYSVLLIATLGFQKEKILPSSTAQDIASLIHKNIVPSRDWIKRFPSRKEALAYHAFLKRLISGELDVDRMDYLLRDAYFTGVSYGHYDLEWLLRSMGAVLRRGVPILILREGALKAFEDFLLARHHMFLQVYFHHTTAIFGHYVEQAMLDREIPLEIPADPYAYAEMRDASIIEALFAAAKNSKNAWAGRLVRREPARVIYRHESALSGSQARYEQITNTLKSKKIPYIERAARKTLLEHPVAKSGDSRILIAKKFLDSAEYLPVEEVSALFQKYNEKIDQVYIYVLREDHRRALAALQRLR